MRRGRLYASQGRFEEAIADMDNAISLDTANTFAYFNRALMYDEKSRLNEAMADLNKVLEFEPGNALTLYNRSLIRAQVGDYANALEDMDRVYHHVEKDNKGLALWSVKGDLRDKYGIAAAK